MPHDIEAERMILSSCLSSVNAVNFCCAELSLEDFFSSDNRELFSKILDLYHRDCTVSLDTLCHLLNKCSLQKSVSYLVQMSMACGTGADYDHYCKIIKTKTALRRLINASQEAIDFALKENADPGLITNELQNKFLAAQGIGQSKPVTYTDKMHDFKENKDFYEYYMHLLDRKSKGLPPYEGVSSSYPQLDHTLGFFQKSALYYIGARTSMGKTTFMCNLVRNIMKKYTVGIFSLEQPTFRLVEKIACMDAHIKHTSYEDGTLSLENRERLKEAIKASKNANVIIEDPSAITMGKLASRAKRMRNSGIQILFVDYLTRIKHEGTHQNKHLMVDEISKALQNLAKEIEIPIVCFAQLNRNSTTKEKPSLTDFRESGSIEEDADACLLIHRPSYYNPTIKPGLTEIIVAKNRLRGIIKTIDFGCNYQESEVYEELPEISEALQNVQATKWSPEEHKEFFKQFKDD